MRPALYLFPHRSTKISAKIHDLESDFIEEMIAEIVAIDTVSVSQVGVPTLFKPRTLTDVYSQIRMLDASGYPHSYFEGDELLKVA